MSLVIALIALIIERIAGYPQKLVGAIGHPVIWIGQLIEWGEGRYNDPNLEFEKRKSAGMVGMICLLVLTLIIGSAISNALRTLPYGFLIEAFLASSLLAQKGLREAVLNVAKALRTGDINVAREAVSHIVGRDTANLDEAEISRASIETLAENASDGVVAPLFYLVLFGLPGALVYKAINTADSMIGHRSERYEAFGWAAAKIDDVANYIPARLTAFLFIAMAALMPEASPKGAYRAAMRDADKHASPNAGWPEAAMAGALDFGLGGPRAYQGEMLDLPQMGDGRRALEAADIERSIDLYDRMLWGLWGILSALAIIWISAQV